MSKLIIGLAGQKGSGKDTAFERIHRILGGNAARFAFADRLKRLAAHSLGVDDLEWFDTAKNDPKAHIQSRGGQGIAGDVFARQFLQFLGEGAREFIGHWAWVEPVMLEIADADVAVACITDVRYPNEAQSIIDDGGSIWNVHGVEYVAPEHSSEVPLPNELIDLHINNNVRDDDYANLDAQLATALAKAAVRA